MTEAAYFWQEKDLYLKLKVIPKSSKTIFSEIKENRIVVRLQAPPVDGKANKALIDFLSKQFKVAKTRIQLINGGNSRLKTVLIPNPKQLPSII